MWAVMSAPLLISADVGQVSKYSLETWGNEEIIEVNQQFRAGGPYQGTRLVGGDLNFGAVEGGGWTGSGHNVWGKLLADQDFALVFVSNEDVAMNVTCGPSCFAALGAENSVTYSVRDLWSKTSVGEISAPFTWTAFNLPIHGGVALYRFTPVQNFSALNGGCAADIDCSLNGICNGGSCDCDAPWSGDACETLDVKPVSFPQGYGQSPKTTSWGGGIIKGDDEKYHMFVSRMTNDCPLSTWTQNSRIDHAVSSSVEGPYEFVDVAVPTWAHNAAPIKLHDGSFAIIHIGTGVGPANGGKNCSSRSSLEDEGSSAGGSSIHVSKSLYGPWEPLKTSLGSCNNPAPWVHPNGTIYVGCGGSLLRSESLTGPFDKIAAFPMSGGPTGNYEDPQLYVDKRGHFHCFYHVYRTDLPSTDCTASTVSAHAFSVDGYAWSISKTQPFGTQVPLSNGTTVTVATRERPKPFFDDQGRMTHLVNGVCASASCTDSKTGCVDCKYNHWDYTLVQPLRLD